MIYDDFEFCMFEVFRSRASDVFNDFVDLLKYLFYVDQFERVNGVFYSYEGLREFFVQFMNTIHDRCMRYCDFSPSEREGVKNLIVTLDEFCEVCRLKYGVPKMRTVRRNSKTYMKFSLWFKDLWTSFMNYNKKIEKFNNELKMKYGDDLY